MLVPHLGHMGRDVVATSANGPDLGRESLEQLPPPTDICMLAQRRRVLLFVPGPWLPHHFQFAAMLAGPLQASAHVGKGGGVHSPRNFCAPRRQPS